MKIIRKDSNEYRIGRRLLYADELFQDDFRGVLPPVAILDTSYEFSFVVMPMYVTVP